MLKNNANTHLQFHIPSKVTDCVQETVETWYKIEYKKRYSYRTAKTK